MENTKILADRFVESMFRTRALNTARAYKNSIHKFVEFMGDRALSSDLFISYAAWLAQEEYAKKTVIVYQTAAKNFLNWLIIEKVLEPSYSDGVRLTLAYKESAAKRQEGLAREADPEEIALVVKQAYLSTLPSPIRERNIAIVEFLLSSGCRISELCGLKIGQINLAKFEAVVTSKGKSRSQPFSELAARRLQEYWKARNNANLNSPAFARHDDAAKKGDKPLGILGARLAVQDLAHQAGIAIFFPHLFRHHFATKFINETGDLAMTQDAMGHKTPAATRVYAKVDRARLKKAHKDIFG